jgi:hypothetical protein
MNYLYKSALYFLMITLDQKFHSISLTEIFHNVKFKFLIRVYFYRWFSLIF